MKNGYVYILTNSSFPDFIKIGKTARDSKLRAQELSSNSGVPTPFKVAFEIFSTEYEEIEKKAHLKLDNFRVSHNREFFRYPLNEAINLLIELNTPKQSELEKFQAIDITKELSEKYPNHLKDDIVSVRIVQPESRVWLEVTTEKISEDGRLLDQTIRREDLAYIVSGNNIEDNLFFSPKDSVQVNAIKYIEEFDPYSIIMTSDIFKEEYCHKIDEEYRNKFPE